MVLPPTLFAILEKVLKVRFTAALASISPTMQATPSSPPFVLGRAKTLLLGVLAGALLTSTPALVSAATSGTTSGTTLRIAMTAADIPYTAGEPDQGFEGNRFVGITVFDSLTQWDLSKADGPSLLIPDLATDWQQDPKDRTKWTFKLRPGVKFHDGSAFNADAVVWNVNKVMTKDASQFDPRQAGLTMSRMPSLVGVRKIDDMTIELTTKQPDPFLPYALVNLYFASPTLWQKDLAGVPASITDPSKRGQAAWAAFAAHPAGTGPFKVVNLVPRQRLDLAANPDYWDPKRRPKIDKVVLMPMPEASARTAALLSGQVDWIEAPAPDAIPAIKARGFKIYANTQPHNWPWQFSYLPGSPWNDIRVRKAANLCVDRAGLKQLLGGYMTPATGIYEPGDPWYGNPTFKIKYDPTEARKLMTEAGYSATKPVEVKVQISTSGSGQMQPQQMNEYIQQNLKGCFFDVKFDVVEWNTLLSNWRLGAKDPTAHGANAINVTFSSMDPYFGIIRFATKRSFPPLAANWGYYSDATTEKLADEAENATTPAVRDKALGELNAYMIDQASNLYVAHDVGPRALSAKITGVVQPKNWFIDIATMSMK